MKTEIVKLTQVKVNKANPRSIRKDKMLLLVERLLAFPKMIEARPVVVDDTMTVLGGNMRVRALNLIAGMDIVEIRGKLEGTKNWQRATAAERDVMLDRWQAWLDSPTVPIVRADTFTDEEKKEFIIADNASFGEWDYDLLANQWDGEDLKSWGVDVWQEPIRPDAAGAPTEGAAAGGAALPVELQGQDITPDDLPKVEGDDDTAMERIIIVYPKEKEAAVCSLIHLESIDKVVYSIDELGK